MDGGLYTFPEHLKYTKDHEWLRDDGGVFVVGVTDHAADLLGDVTFVELPAVGMKIRQGSEAATVESVKAAGEVYAPVGGRVSEINEALEDHPELVNQSPYESGWFFKLDDVNKAEIDDLLDAEAYKRFVAENV